MVKFYSILSILFFFINVAPKPLEAKESFQQKKVYLENFLPKGFVKDGSIDYTTIIQKCIIQYDYVILPNFPLLINDIGIKLRDNSSLEFQSGSWFIKKSTTKESYNIIEIHNAKNVLVIGANIKGDRDTHIGKTGEHGMGIAIRSSSNVRIENANIINCWGDGIYIGRLTLYDKTGSYIPSRDILLENIKLDNNRRNALSITAGVSITVRNLSASNTKGIAPMAGIDIEPNSNKDYIDNINLENINTKNNRYGVQIVLKKMIGERQRSASININGHIDNNSQIAMRFDKFDREGKNITGKINISNATWNNNKNKSLDFNGSQEMGPNIILSNIKSVNNNRVLSVKKLKDSTIKSENIYFH